MSEMKDFFYDTVIAPTEFRAPTAEEIKIKQDAWNTLIPKQVSATPYPKGSNQDEMYEMEKEYWVNVAQQDRFNPNKNCGVKDAINPSHYKGIIGELQYIECMEFILGKDGLAAHLKGQGYKYLMRMGKKDEEMQELKKALWYLKCLNILMRNGTIVGKVGELNG